MIVVRLASELTGQTVVRDPAASSWPRKLGTEESRVMRISIDIPRVTAGGKVLRPIPFPEIGIATTLFLKEGRQLTMSVLGSTARKVRS